MIRLLLWLVLANVLGFALYLALLSRVLLWWHRRAARRAAADADRRG